MAALTKRKPGSASKGSALKVTGLREHNGEETRNTASYESPTGDLAKASATWRKAMACILIGLALRAFYWSFFSISSLLFVIGIILQLLGFRALRRENTCFKASWVATLVLATEYFSELLIYATLYNSAFFASGFGTALLWITLGLKLSQAFCFWQALACAQKKAGPRQRRHGALRLLSLKGQHAGTEIACGIRTATRSTKARLFLRCSTG